MMVLRSPVAADTVGPARLTEYRPIHRRPVGTHLRLGRIPANLVATDDGLTTCGGSVSSHRQCSAWPVLDTRPVDRSRIGAVERIAPIRECPQGTGAGAVIGGVRGAVVGKRFGHGVGRGRDERS